VSVHYYNGTLKQGVDPRLASEQQRLFNRLRDIEGFQVVLCRRQRRVGDDGNARFVIKGDDIHLAIDMLRGAYEDAFDITVLLSGDGDFSPAVAAVTACGKTVENHYFAGQASLELQRSCVASYVIDKKTAKRFFYRDQAARSSKHL
jgi:uncharacterized LabA/DUF88 family protein